MIKMIIAHVSEDASAKKQPTVCTSCNRGKAQLKSFAVLSQQKN